MKMIKLSGREAAVLRAIDNTGSTGEEIFDRTQIVSADLADILNALCDIGYVEAYAPNSHLPHMGAVLEEAVMATRFEVNPSYALELKKALKRG